MSSNLSLGSPLAILVIVSMFLYWIISGIVLFILYRFGNRTSKRKAKATTPKSISDKSYDMKFYERGLSRNKVGPAATGV